MAWTKAVPIAANWLTSWTADRVVTSIVVHDESKETMQVYSCTYSSRGSITCGELSPMAGSTKPGATICSPIVAVELTTMMTSNKASIPSCTVNVISWWLVPRNSATVRAAAKSGEPAMPTEKVSRVWCLLNSYPVMRLPGSTVRQRVRKQGVKGEGIHFQAVHLAAEHQLVRHPLLYLTNKLATWANALVHAIACTSQQVPEMCMSATTLIIQQPMSPQTHHIAPAPPL